MSNSNDRRDLYTRLLAISHEALEAGHHEVAYHALSAALHYAQNTRDIERLNEVSRTATEQLAYINANAPGSVMSTTSAQKRSGVDMYDTLARMAEIRSKMLRGVD
jgi:hypothetical protein